MSKSATRVTTAAVALLALASPVAHSLDAGPRYASVDPAAFRQTASPDNTKAVQTRGKAPLQKKPKAAKNSKAKILAGLNNYRSPARRALDHAKHTDRNCEVATIACPVALRDGKDRGQAWPDAPLQHPAPDTVGNPLEDAPSNTAPSSPALVRPHTDVPGLVPGRESGYKFSLNLPLGRYENVMLQANVRKNAYNTQNTSDSTLRADWSLRF
jgi:hypothetical protein